MLNITGVKAFNDNYLWVFNAQGATAACVVDPGAAEPVLAYLQQAGLELAAILVTHHHNDHIGGIDTLLQHRQVPVYGPASARIPQVTHVVSEGSSVQVPGCEFSVLEIPGHTLEHIGYYTKMPVTKAGPALFCGDTLFGAGCGRMFEGNPPMMHASLQKLAALRADTQVYCAHEYTLSNLRFALAVMPENPDLLARITTDSSLREQQQPTIPSSIGVELKTNPFLRCTDPLVIAAAHRHEHSANDPAAVFGTLRRWKDSF